VLVVAHNAKFDRKFAERFCSTFSTKAWGCSMSDVDWAAEGYEGAKLAYLAANCGFFYRGHRARHDCEAGVEMIDRCLKTARLGVPAIGRTDRPTMDRRPLRHDLATG
jgi:DNA polymerase-3 subunit epsilon